MATTPVEITFSSGITGMTADVFPRGSNTADATGLSLTEQTNKKGAYRFDVTQALSGIKDVVLKNSGGSWLAITRIEIDDDTDVHYEVSKADNCDENRTSGDVQQYDNRIHGGG